MIHYYCSSSRNAANVDIVPQELVRDESHYVRLAAIDALLEAYPEAIAIPDHSGQTPLHVACLVQDAKTTRNIVELMLQHPSHVGAALAVQDNNGQSPLHCFMLFLAKVLLDIHDYRDVDLDSDSFVGLQPKPL